MENSELNFCQKLWESLVSIKNQKPLSVSLAIALFASGIYLAANIHLIKSDNSSIFADFIDPIITILTFITALALGLSNLYFNWEASLEKRLTVFYIFYYDSLNSMEAGLKSKNINDDRIQKQNEFIEKNKLKERTSYCLIICEDALLAHEGDIRNWGQQLGSQFEAQGKLSFHPFFSLGRNKAITRKVIDKKVVVNKQYSIFIFLDKIPDTILKNEKGILSTDNYDDRPSNKIRHFKIDAVNYKSMKEHSNITSYINSLDYYDTEQINNIIQV